MQEQLFENWLKDQSYANKRVVSDNKSRCKRVENGLSIDLDEEFRRDTLGSVLEKLTYEKEDAENGMPLPLPMDSAKPWQGFATLRTAVRNYRAFRQAGTIEGVASRQRACFDDLANAYEDWLKEDVTASLASDYKSYLSQLKDAFEQCNGAASFDNLAKSFENGNADQANAQVLLCQNFILSNRSSDTAHLGDWSNRFDAFKRFVDFLVSRYEVEIESDVATQTPQEDSRESRPSTAELRTASFAFSLDRRDLKSTFYNRLTTQSRSYLTNGIGLIFPVRLMNTIFRDSRDNRFRNLIDEDIARIKFSGEGETSCSFNEVSKVKFDGEGNVTVVKNNGQEFELFTRMRRGNYEKMNALTANILSIDHVTPMENKMRIHKDELNALKRITECFNEFNYDGRLDPRRDSEWKDSLLAAYPELYAEELRNQILADLNLIRVDYEIMDKRENSSRGNRQ